MAQFHTVASTHTYLSTDNKDSRYFVAGQVIPMDEAVRFGLSGAVADTPSSRENAVAATATTAGTGAGQLPLPSGEDFFVTVTSDDVNKIVTLPDAPIGTKITLQNGATGYELRTHAPATVGINGGVGANAESAIAANITVTCVRTTATNWVSDSMSAAGVVSVTQVAAP